MYYELKELALHYKRNSLMYLAMVYGLMVEAFSHIGLEYVRNFFQRRQADILEELIRIGYRLYCIGLIRNYFAD